MQEPAAPSGTVGPDGNGPDPAGTPAADARALAPGADADPSTALVEVLPGIAVVFGEVPDVLKADLVDFGVVPTGDRAQLTATLASLVGSTATIGGNLGTAMAGAQGLYRVADATQALLNSGATLAVKDGAHLGSVWLDGELVAQARFIPVNAVGTAATLAAIGPAVAMIAMQMQLNQISGLVTTNIALTTQVLSTIRNEQWAELTGHVAALDRALERAHEIGAVPSSLWDTVSGNEAALVKQRDLYRRNVHDHCKQLDRLDGRARREYLETNTEAIVFDANALVSALKAWTTYQALHAGKARTAGTHDADEARLVDIIARDTRAELEPALAETTRLVDSLRRELHLVADLPGRATIPLTRKRKDAKAARFTGGELLQAITPLADALRTPPPPLRRPEIVSPLKDVDLEPYLRVLRWFVEDDETLRCLAFCHQRDDDFVRSVGQSVRSRIDAEKSATLVTVTDRRVIVSRANALRQEGRLGRVIPVDDVRYVRARTAAEGSGRPEIDLIARDRDFAWVFPSDAESAPIDALVAVLAEAMTLPEREREALIHRTRAQIAAPGPDDDEAAVGSSAVAGVAEVAEAADVAS